MSASWVTVLDVLEERVEAHAAVLRGEMAADPYQLPEGIGPLPLDLVGRACVILARQQELEAELTVQMEQLRTFFRARGRESAPVPVYLDARA